MIAGFSIHDELAALVAAGFSPCEAIRAATRGAAEFLGAVSEFGDVKPGLRADLVLVTGNPLEDVASLREPVGVMVRGRWLARSDLEEMLREVAERRRGD